MFALKITEPITVIVYSTGNFGNSFGQPALLTFHNNQSGSPTVSPQKVQFLTMTTDFPPTTIALHKPASIYILGLNFL